MSRARVVVELLPDDTSGTRLVQSLGRTLDVPFSGLTCTVEKRHDFDIAPTLELGVTNAVRQVATYPDPWCVYMSPRRLVVRVNGKTELLIAGVLIAIARNREPAALFLQTMTLEDVPHHIGMAFSDKINELREMLVTCELSESDEGVVERIRTGIENAYVGALLSPSLNS